MIRRLGVVVATSIVAFLMLTGCQAGGQETVDNKATENTEVEVSSEKIVVDQNGTEVLVPENVDKLVMSALPLPSIYALTGEPLDKVVGMHPGAKSAIESSIMGKMYPELLDASTGFVEGTDINIEELLKLNPDLVFYWGPYSNQTQQLKESGIPSIGVKTQGGGDALLTLASWLEIMGQVFDKESEVQNVIKYGENTLNEISQKVSNIEDDEKVNSLFLFKHSSQEIIVPGKGHYGDWWITEAGGKNVAGEIDVTKNVNMEQIYKWNPQVIFITSFTSTMPEDLYENRIEGQDWSGVDAVINKRVYKVPVGVYRWYPPSGDVALMMKWMAESQYPEVFDYDMKEEVKSYYNEFYGYDLLEEEIDSILNSSQDSAKGTGGLGVQK
jgi:iron complex transport system substrate-binding protein